MTTHDPIRCPDPSCDHPAHWAECGAERCLSASGGPAIVRVGTPSGLCPACESVPTCPNCGQDNAPDGPGCACYGTPTPRYPSSADLATFRHLIHGERPPHHADQCDDGMSHPDHPDCSDPSAAWPDERANGIGYDFRTEGMGIDYDYDDAALCAIARREAAAMRSRAYERAFGSWQYACNVARDRGYDAGDWRPFIATDDDRAAHQTFLPR
jgi:hypothetical protein